jgi:hypothetical protein
LPKDGATLGGGGVTAGGGCTWEEVTRGKIANEEWEVKSEE